MRSIKLPRPRSKSPPQLTKLTRFQFQLRLQRLLPQLLLPPLQIPLLFWISFLDYNIIFSFPLVLSLFQFLQVYFQACPCGGEIHYTEHSSFNPIAKAACHLQGCIHKILARGGRTWGMEKKGGGGAEGPTKYHMAVRPR